MQNFFSQRAGELNVEEVPLAHIATQFGTPCYVYSRAAIEAQWRAFDSAFGPRAHTVCYAVKANSTLAVLQLLARLGSGFDIVSGGELVRVLQAGGDPARVIFSGVGKTEAEMRAALDAGVRCFNVESVGELERLNAVAGVMQMTAPIALRVNPDVDADTHPYISTGLKDNKFGIPIADARAIYRRARDLPHLQVIGVDCHIGSQLTSVAPFLDALERVLTLVDTLAADGIVLAQLDIGGGLGIRYRDEAPPTPADYIGKICARLGRDPTRYGHLSISVEPGRAIVGNAGVLLTRVEYLKHGETKNFAIVDAAMNDLMRPTLYDAYHAIEPVTPRADKPRPYDVVGPVCESGDFLGRARALAIRPGDLLAIRSAGAYGASMSSNYNTRPRAAEVMVAGSEVHLVRRREAVAELFAGESLLP